MAIHIGERFLCNPKEHRALGGRQLFHFRKGLQVNVDAGLRSEIFHERMQGGNQSEIVEHRRAQFAREFMHDVHGFFYQQLCASEMAVKNFGVAPCVLLQGGKAKIDAGQSLGDDIMQFATDALAFFFLRLQNLTGKIPQLFLHEARLLQHLALVLLAFSQGFLNHFPSGNLLSQLLVRGFGGVRAALRFLCPFENGDVRDHHPAPFS